MSLSAQGKALSCEERCETSTEWGKSCNYFADRFCFAHFLQLSFFVWACKMWYRREMCANVPQLAFLPFEIERKLCFFLLHFEAVPKRVFRHWVCVAQPTSSLCRGRLNGGGEKKNWMEGNHLSSRRQHFSTRRPFRHSINDRSTSEEYSKVLTMRTRLVIEMCSGERAEKWCSV